MLKGMDPRLNAEVLYALRAMGHGDVLIIADTNFPSDSIARATVLGELLRMDNLTAAEATEAVLSVLPLDTFVDDFAGRMEIVGSPDEVAPGDAMIGRCPAMQVVYKAIGRVAAQNVTVLIRGWRRRAVVARQAYNPGPRAFPRACLSSPPEGCPDVANPPCRRRVAGSIVARSELDPAAPDRFAAGGEGECDGDGRQCAHGWILSGYA